MSSSSRVLELRTSLERELALQSGPRERLLWLADHLVEYVDRFTGFAVLPEVTLDAVMRSDLFVVVEIAADRLRREVEQLPDEVGLLAACVTFEESLKHLEHDAHPQRLDHLLSRAKELGLAIGEVRLS